MIKKIKLFSNCYDYSKKIETELKNKLECEGFIISEDLDEIDLAIAIGGDGSFLRIIADKVEKTNKMRTGGGHRPSYLFRYKKN